MKPVATFTVSPTMPETLAPLKELAYNYWWCWHQPAIELFRQIDPVRWESVGHNPVALLAELPPNRLEDLSNSNDFMAQLREIYDTYRAYMDDRGWYSTIERSSASYVAYFCAEFGIHESFTSYSGGLGVLAGDHLKSASDLGLPLVAVGLLYQEGYFSQYLTQNGWQNEKYKEVEFHVLPLTLVETSDGSPLMVTVDLPQGSCNVQIWRMNVGRVPLYLLDTNVEQPDDSSMKNITDRLYGGDVDTRIMQESILGIGGVRALQALGIEPSAIHINEGHAAFSMLERSRIFMDRYGMTFAEAFRLTAGSSVFTTHTPVPAGNEVFNREKLKEFFGAYITSLGISWDEFIELGTKMDVESEEGFSMTVLGLRGSSHRNGVSKLHGVVARNMWKEVWNDFSLSEVPIAGLTNGIHTATWVGPELADLFDRYLGPQWRKEPHKEESWASIDSIPNRELWSVHQRRRERLVLGARQHILGKHSASLTAEQSTRIDDCLDPNILTIGFARRFATYKRADLLMKDMERLSALIKHAERPVQVVLAGKAHPNDGLGKELIQSVHQKIKEWSLEHRIVFLEDYNMDVARLMVRGCDVWLNTPRRPHEASGTSGMKASVNGVLQCSILDGWWAEAHDGKNGFAIGHGEEFEEVEQDAADSATLYDLIEHRIAPLFYDIGSSGVPDGWVEMMKNCIRTLSWQFSALRMVHDYTVQTYIPTMHRYHDLIENNGQAVRDATQFFDDIKNLWPSISIGEVNVHGGESAYVGKNIRVSTKIDLAGLSPEQVIVQVAYGHVDSHGSIPNVHTATLTYSGMDGRLAEYTGSYECAESGVQGCTVRVIPTHPTLAQVPDAFYVTYANGTG